jgi:hypothetical protein
MVVTPTTVLTVIVAIVGEFVVDWTISGIYRFFISTKQRENVMDARVKLPSDALYSRC